MSLPVFIYAGYAHIFSAISHREELVQSLFVIFSIC